MRAYLQVLQPVLAFGLLARSLFCSGGDMVTGILHSPSLRNVVELEKERLTGLSLCLYASLTAVPHSGEGVSTRSASVIVFNSQSTPRRFTSLRHLLSIIHLLLGFSSFICKDTFTRTGLFHLLYFFLQNRNPL